MSYIKRTVCVMFAAAELLSVGHAVPTAYPINTIVSDPADQIESFQSGTEPSVICQYDQKGNMQNGPASLSVHYDYENRPTRIEKDGVVINYSYNGLGDRVMHQVDSECSKEIPDYGSGLKNTLLETTAEGVPQRYYLWAAGLIGHVDVNPDTGAETVVYYHGNEVGSTLALTDGEGKVTDTYVYTPYGEVSTQEGTTETPYLYNGGLGVRHEGDGIYHMKARYYSAKLKRFLTRDSLGLDGGHNLYTFADGNPISFADPFGLCAESYANSYWNSQYRFWGFGENDVTYDDIQFAIGAANHQPASGLNLGVRAFGLAETTLGLAATVHGAGNVSVGVATLPVGGPASASLAALGVFETTWGVAHTDAGMKKLFTGQWYDSFITTALNDHFLDDIEAARMLDAGMGLQGLMFSVNMNSQLSLPRSQVRYDSEGYLQLDESYTYVANKNASGVYEVEMPGAVSRSLMASGSSSLYDRSASLVVRNDMLPAVRENVLSATASVGLGPMNLLHPFNVDKSLKLAGEIQLFFCRDTGMETYHHFLQSGLQPQGAGREIYKDHNYIVRTARMGDLSAIDEMSIGGFMRNYANHDVPTFARGLHNWRDIHLNTMTKSLDQAMFPPDVPVSDFFVIESVHKPKRIVGAMIGQTDSDHNDYYISQLESVQKGGGTAGIKGAVKRSLELGHNGHRC